MILNGKTLVRLMKERWKDDGYTVAAFSNSRDWLGLDGTGWVAVAERSMMPRMAMAAIVEHAGDLPKAGEEWLLQKGAGTQIQNYEIVMEQIEELLEYSDESKLDRMHRTILTMGSYRLWQNTKDLSIWKMQPEKTNIAAAPENKIVAAGQYLCMRGSVSAAFVLHAPVDKGEKEQIEYLEQMQWA